MPTKDQIYAARVEEVYSGDDMVMMVDLGTENLHLKQRIRLYGVDTPNGLGAAPDTPAGIIRTHVRNLIRGKQVKIRVISRGSNSWIAVVTATHEGQEFSLNDRLIQEGFKYIREKTQS